MAARSPRGRAGAGAAEKGARGRGGGAGRRAARGSEAECARPRSVRNPEPVQGDIMTIVSIVGIAINLT